MQNSQTNTFLKGMNLDTAKEFVGTEQYIDAQNVHVVTTDGGTSGALQPYADLKTIASKISGTVLGTTVGHIQWNKEKTECFIVLHYEDEDKLYKLSVYSLDGFYTNIKTIETKTFGFEPSGQVKLINIWENSETSRVYMCGEDSYIQAVNINHDYGTKADTEYYDFSIFPKCGALTPPKFDRIVRGSKSAGKVQYAYQLFDKTGRTTAISAVSHMIPIGAELQDDITDQGVQIRCENLPVEYTYVRLYEIRYNNFTDIPRIYVKDEFKRTTESITYSDTSDDFLSELSIEEFQSVKSAVFKSSTIEVKDNRLFAANITQQTFDVPDFDARIYAADINGELECTDISGTKYSYTIDEIVAGKQIDETFVFNNEQPDAFKYGVKFTADGHRVLGGAGPNIQYEFISPLLYAESNSDFVRNVGSDFEKCLTSASAKDTSKSSFSEITLLSQFHKKQELHYQSSAYYPDNIEIVKVDSNLHTITKLNYSDPYVCSNYVGFKQGECYSFGIVFYNESNIPSPTHYIGTIHIPYIRNTYSTIKDQNGVVHDLAVAPIGIRFRVNTEGLSDKGVVAYEIVREQKQTNSRKILCQGIASTTYPFGEKLSNWSNGDSDLRFPIFPTYGYRIITTPYYKFYYSYPYEHKLNQEYISIVSPEISTNKENIETSLESVSEIRPIKALFSLLYTNEDMWHKVHTNIQGGGTFDGYQAHPVANYLTYATAPSDSYVIDGKEYKHYKVFGTTSLHKDYADYTKFEGIPLRSGTYNYDSRHNIAYTLFKFYESSDQLDLQHSSIKIKSLKFCKTLATDQVGETSSQFSTSIGDKGVVNMCVAYYSGDGYKDLTYGGHCNCVVAQSSNNAFNICAIATTNLNIRIGSEINTKLTDKFTYTYPNIVAYSGEAEITREPYLSNFSALLDSKLAWPSGDDANQTLPVNIPGVMVVDLKTPYISNVSYSELSKIIYTSQGNYVKIGQESTSDIDVFGGDTYVCVHKEMWCGYGYDTEYKSEVANRASVNIKYPVETRINLDRVTGPNYDTVEQNIGLQFEPGQSVLGYSQELPLNAYNDAYSAQEYNKVFVTKGMYDIADQHIGNRIVASEVKSTGELSDSFQNFKIANYIDVDAQYGNITNLVKYNNRLYYLQSTAFGTVAVNERSLITDNNQAALLLGTGDVLARYDNISTFDGSDVVNDPSVLVSPSSLYWYDSNKKSLCVFNEGGLNSLSKVKQAQSYFNHLNKDHVVHSGYDTKNNEVWFYPEEKSRSIIYSEQVQAFTGFYTMPVKFAQVASEFSIGINGNNFVQFGKKSDQKLADCYVKFVVNKEPAIPKVYDSMMLSDCYTPAFSKLVIPFNVACATNRQGPVSGQYPNSVTNREGVYYVSIGRDQNKERMRDKTMTVQLTFEDTNFNVPFVNTIYRYSRI